MMNRIDNSGEGIARLGRDEDNYLAHVAQGEMVVPPVITPETRQRLEQDMMNMGLDPNEYTVGGGMSINPITGNPEFGFLKKIAKGLKKVVKKIAPVAAVIPGPWQGPAIAYNRGRAVINIAKGEGGIGDLVTAFTPNKAYTGGKTGNIFGNTKEFFTKGGDGVGFFGNVKQGIGNLKDTVGDYVFKGSDETGLFGNLGKDAYKAYDYVMPGSDETGLFGNLKKDFLTGTANAKETLSQEEFDALSSTEKQLYMLEQQQAQTSGSPFNIGRSLLGKGNTPDAVKSFEDMLKSGGSKIFSGEVGGLGNAGIAGLAGLIGKLAYDEAKNFKGVPLTPLTTMDELGRYNVAAEVARQKGEAMPSRVEYGLNPSTLPILQGGGFDKTARKPIGAAAGGIMSFANGSTPFDINVRNQENEAFASQVMKGMQRNPNLLNELTSEQKQMFEHGLLMGGEEGVFMKIIKKMRDEGNNYQPSPNMSNIYTAYISATKQAEQMNMGGIMAFAQGGAVAMAAGGELPIDPANFPVMDGQIDGPGTETSDDIPAMLSDGEFVMTAKAVKGAGGFNVAANDSNGIVTLTPNGEPSRDSGTRVMYKLMEHFGAVA